MSSVIRRFTVRGVVKIFREWRIISDKSIAAQTVLEPGGPFACQHNIWKYRYVVLIWRGIIFLMIVRSLRCKVLFPLLRRALSLYSA